MVVCVSVVKAAFALRRLGSAAAIENGWMESSPANPCVSSLFQEFMAALYVFTMFRSNSKNILDSSKSQSQSVADLLRCALERTVGAPPGHYDMFLRFLCGLLFPDCHDNQLSGFLYSHQAPKLRGLREAQQLLERRIEAAPTHNRERLDNLKECLREMTQEDP